MNTYQNIYKIILIGDSGAGKSSLLLRYCQNTFSTDLTSTIGVDFRIKHETIGNHHVKLNIHDSSGQERFSSLTVSYYRGCAAIVLVYDITNRSSFERLDKWLVDIIPYMKENVKVILIGNKIDLVAESDADTQSQQPKESDAEQLDDQQPKESDAQQPETQQQTDSETQSQQPKESDDQQQTDSETQQSDAKQPNESESQQQPQSQDLTTKSQNKPLAQREVSYQEGQEFAKKHNMLFIETSAKSGENVIQAFRRVVQEALQAQDDAGGTMKHRPRDTLRLPDLERANTIKAQKERNCSC